MSLIEQALRRVQQPAVPDPAAKASTHGSPQPAAPPGSPGPIPAAATAPAAPVQTNKMLVPVATTILALGVLLTIGGAFWMAGIFDLNKPAGILREESIAYRNAPAPMVPSAPSAPQPLAQTTRMPRPTVKPPIAQVATPAARRPFIPTTRPAPIRPEQYFVVSGVAEGRGVAYAVINGQIVMVGEDVDGATLLEVANSTVTLRPVDGADFVLRVPR